MLNNDLYNELEHRFGKDQMINISEAVSYMYSILFKNNQDNYLLTGITDGSEYNFERDWWMDKHKELSESHIGYSSSKGITFEGVSIVKKDGTQEFIKNLGQK